MPDSIPDYEQQLARIERHLRRLKKMDIDPIKEIAARANENEDEIPRLEAAHRTVLTVWGQFQNLYDQRQELLAHAEMSDAEAEVWDTLYHSARALILDAEVTLSRLNRRREQGTPNLPPAHNHELDGRLNEVPEARAVSPPNYPVPGHNTTFMQSSRSHLPIIQMPQFHGDLTKWNHFKDTYKSLVHDDPNLSNVEKFHYLLSSLKGNAASLISRFQIDDRSYSLAWEKLIRAYDNPRILGSMYIQRMLESSTRAIKSESRRYEAYLSNIGDSLDGFRSLDLANREEFILSALALRDLDPDTRRSFELTQRDRRDYPKADDIIEFVRQRASAIKLTQEFNFGTSHSQEPKQRHQEPSFHQRTQSRTSPKYDSISMHSSAFGGQSKKKSQERSSIAQSQRSTSTQKCPYCGGFHILVNCHSFLNAPCERRISFTDGYKCCRNCLRADHAASRCPSKWSCRYCRQRHHSLLHSETKNGSEDTKPTKPIRSGSGQPSFIGFGSTALTAQGAPTVLLSTAQILIKDSRNGFHAARAILDCGSQQTFITMAMARVIGDKVTSYTSRINGLGGAATTRPLGMIKCTIKSPATAVELSTSAIVIDTISPPLPSRDIDPSIQASLSRFELADYSFGRSSQIDVLIGADLFPLIMSGSPYHSGESDLYLLPTIFGLTVMGGIPEQEADTHSSFFSTTPAIVEEQLKAFWELEEPSEVSRNHPNDDICEEHFMQTHTRSTEGRYVVRLPFMSANPEMGDNRDMVKKRFISLEQKLQCNDLMAEKYKEFMREYIALGHMSPATSPSPYLIPHHGIWQVGPTGQKLRVVFDASCSSSQSSLNDTLHTGPKLQNDLCNILLRFRTYEIPLCGDIVKMYRQILVHPLDRKFQHILWRENSSDRLVEYELSTVTYGIKPSAYQALRVIKQLIIDEGAKYPLAAARISTDMYVDDLVSGASTLAEAVQLQEEIIALLGKGGFELGKWASTHTSLIPDTRDAAKCVPIHQSDEDYLKILGLCWDSSRDPFTYCTQSPPNKNVTKRAMLSAVARIFDPLGLLAPITFKAKAMIQEVWKAKLGWDDVLPDTLSKEWQSLTERWEDISKIRVPRLICTDNSKVTLIGFCDASLKGYSAVVYLRSENPPDEVKVSLIKAKSKVAPLKYISIARLELCGALLLAQVIDSVRSTGLAKDIVCFTDSQVVLSWLNSPSYSLKVFEANRTAGILKKVPLCSWNHVASEDNPADLASRGRCPPDLRSNQLWWSGPDWLKRPIDSWSKPLENPTFSGEVVIDETPIRRPPVPLMTTLTSRVSSYAAVVRIIARVVRFVKACKRESRNKTLEISAEEYTHAETTTFRLVQRAHLPKELFHDSTTVPTHLQHLSPFLDEDGVVKVGGRLDMAPVEYAYKHPILIPQQAHLAKLIVKHYHQEHFHAGPSLTMALLKGKFWIPRASRLVRSCINHCVQCRISRAKPVHPRMAPLPTERFCEGRAFLQVGVDYAGPILIKEGNRRKAPISKAYMCLFVCFATKALHLELVTSLTTAAFLATLDRFMARRGIPECLWSDHGTNFIGASRYLKDLHIFLKENEDVIAGNLAPRSVGWKFIPPRAPHFGGLWEAGVKSVKTLLTSATGKLHLTFEELSTILTRVEAMLNSRPLCTLTEDPENFGYLTPGHFLTGSSKLALPESCTVTPPSIAALRKRWLYVQDHTTYIWERWRKEYLNSLQQRSKWTKKSPELQIGDLVILRERRTNVGVWPVGRVTETYPGHDGVTRTVEVLTPSGHRLTRAATSLVPLFPPDAEDGIRE